MRISPAVQSCTMMSPFGVPPAASQAWQAPSVGWPAKASSLRGVKMRTR
jgi:hypothetical protein